MAVTAAIRRIFPRPGPSGGRRGLSWTEIALRLAAIGYIMLFVGLPVLAISGRTFSDGLGQFWRDLMQPEAWFSIKLTVVLALVMVAVNCVTGTATAWVFVRYRFPGSTVLNAIIDLPFAIPTVVTGVMLAVLYGPQSAVGQFFTDRGIQVIYAKPGIVLALLFVTFPFTVRAVQPVLISLDREMEEAAATLGASRLVIFFKVVLPSIAHAVLTGATQSFSRALGEFGSVVMVAGNIPMKTQVAPVYIYGEIESYNPRSALAVSMVLLLGSLAMLMLMNVFDRWGKRHDA